MSKAFDEMSSFEYVTWGVLCALEAWLYDRGGTINKIFAMFDTDGDQRISIHHRFSASINECDARCDRSRSSSSHNLRVDQSRPGLRALLVLEDFGPS